MGSILMIYKTKNINNIIQYYFINEKTYKVRL